MVTPSTPATPAPTVSGWTEPAVRPPAPARRRPARLRLPALLLASVGVGLAAVAHHQEDPVVAAAAAGLAAVALTVLAAARA